MGGLKGTGGGEAFDDRSAGFHHVDMKQGCTDKEKMKGHPGGSRS